MLSIIIAFLSGGALGFLICRKLWPQAKAPQKRVKPSEAQVAASFYEWRYITSARGNFWDIKNAYRGGYYAAFK